MYSKVVIKVKETIDKYGYNPASLSHGSKKKVIVECLNCHKIIERPYREANFQHRCSVINGDNKKCIKCKQWKNINLFNKSPKLSGGVSKTCRDCYNSYPSVIKYEKERSKKRKYSIENNDIEYYIKIRISCIKYTSKKNNIKFNLDTIYLYDLWKNQNGLCYYTNIPMKRQIKQNKFQSWDSPSIDRKDPCKGYVKGNVVWCIFSVNSFKQSLNEYEFKENLKRIIWWDYERINHPYFYGLEIIEGL